MQTEVQEREFVYSTAQMPRRRGRLIGAAVLLVAVAVLVIVAAAKWPFTRERIVKSLERQSGSVVEIGQFRRIYLPYPGCVADGVTFRHGTNGPVFLTIRRLAVAGSYPGLLTKHISTVRADAFHLVIAPEGGAASAGANIGTLSDGLTIGRVIADGAEIEFPASEPGHQPLLFRIPKLVLKDLADRQPLNFQTTIELQKPPAEVDVSGKFGPWQSGNAGQTRLSGAYSVKDLDLGAFGGVEGLLAASGNFHGPLEMFRRKEASIFPSSKFAAVGTRSILPRNLKGQ